MWFTIRFGDWMMKKFLGTIIDGEAHVTPPSPFIDKTDEWIHVCSASLAANNGA